MDYQKLSKEISYALRHAPWEYELELDEEGWVEIKQLLYSLCDSLEWNDLTEKDFHIMIKKSDKKRHEILNEKIRALYGHSTPKRIIKEAMTPPEFLYHGTARRFIKSIKENGIIPKNRQYVHLSVDTNTALQVGKRKDYNPVILEINANKAYNHGVKFYIGNEKVWLSDFIPFNFIKIN